MDGRRILARTATVGGMPAFDDKHERCASEPGAPVYCPTFCFLRSSSTHVRVNRNDYKPCFSQLGTVFYPTSDICGGRRVFKRIFLVTTVAMLLVAFAVAPVTALLPNGQQAPNFTLADLSGATHSLTDYRGKVVVIDFFGADCGPCKSSATNDLVPLYNSYYRDDGRVQFLGVEVTGASAAYTSSNFVNPTGITWPVLVGGANVFSSYGSTSTPTVYVLDSAGKVALATTSIDRSTLKSTIDKLAGSGAGSGTGPAVCSQDANSLDVFVQGTDHALWYKQWDGTSWGSWKSLGGALTSSPAAASRSAGKIDVFVRGTDGALWSRATANGGTSWSNWYKIGGQLLAGTGPAAYEWGDARIGVFVTGTNRALYHIWYDASGPWSRWQNLGGALTSSPAATSPASGVIDVSVRGGDGAVWWDHYNGTWSGWSTPLGGSLGGLTPVNSAPAACSWGAGRLDVFVQGIDGALWHKGYTGGKWYGWQSLGGKLTSGPAATAMTATTGDQIGVFVRGGDGALWEKSYSSSSASGWGAWSKIGGQLA